MLWAVDTSDCPYRNDINNKLRLAKYRIDNGLLGKECFDNETYGENGFKSPTELLMWLINNQIEEELVFSHGDYCPPNIFIDDNKIFGFIDLGRAGLLINGRILHCVLEVLNIISGKTVFILISYLMRYN